MSKILSNTHPIILSWLSRKEDRYILRNYKLDVYYSVIGDTTNRRLATELSDMDYLMLPQEIKNKFELVKI
jgi:hypothetical protein